MVYALVGNVFKPVIEIKISENIFRYMARSDKGYMPIIQRAGKWIFEREHTPFASETLISFIQSNKKVKNELISGQIQHNRVGPLSMVRKYQFDKGHNKYLKIANEYFELKVDSSLLMYLEGGGCGVLPLKYHNGKFYIKPSFLSGIYSVTKLPLEIITFNYYGSIYYFDNTIATIIANSDIFIDAVSLEGFHSYEYSKNIDGAIIFEGVEYIPYDNKLIRITANGDDTYILGDSSAKDKSIIICKNPKSTTYFLMPEKATLDSGRESYKPRSSRYLAKRQTFSTCTAGFYESKDISLLLRTHVGAGVKFESPSEILKPYVGINGFFNNIKQENALYYWSNNDVFFMR
ncbi:MAG: hypothetical protein ACMZI0_11825 [Symbiopectobacterium sp.]|uniref:hypothetical protein n=1 Tax=Symbiopectobacterium sp. TaxID=2952789 RepID=UPI0039ED4E38